MSQKQLLKDTIDLVYAYAASEKNKDITLSGFLSYLNAQGLSEDQTMGKKDSIKNDSFNTESDDLGISLVLLNRYANAYLKQVLKNSSLNTADEFSFLISLMVEGSHTKTELINKMVLTKTSGTEVLKRLLQKGHITESEDEEDKRSKRVYLSDQGKKVVMELLPKMSGVSEVVRGNLSSSELNTLNYLLKKLERYHKENFEFLSKEKIQPLL